MTAQLLHPLPVHVQRVLPLAALLATKAVLFASVETKSRLATFIAYPLPPEHVGDPGQGGFDPDHTLLVTADDETEPRIGTVTSEAIPALSAALTLGKFDPNTAPARPLPPPSVPCQKQKSEPELPKLLVQFHEVNESPPQRRTPHLVVLSHAANWFTP